MEDKDRLNASERQHSGADIAGAVNSDLNAAAVQTHMDKFHASQGHGYAAEQANHLYDILTGKDAVIVGGDNAKDGPDRLVNGVTIQTKYCAKASESVAAAFEKGQYRYINPDGSPMQLEVPADQYDEAVELMVKRIKEGKIAGVTDPESAKELVRRGQFTYNQARNIVKFGTVESLTFDAVNGAIISTSAFGITAVLTFANSLWNGASLDIAIENAAYSGLQIGGAAFVNTVITAQLMRTAIPKALVAPTDSVIKLLGPKASANIANALRSGSNIYGAAAMNNMAKLLRCNIITSSVMVVVLSAKDIGNAFRGRISGQQLFKNLATTAGGITGGTAGLIAGKFVLNLIAHGAGEVVGFVVALAGSAAGGTVGGAATNAIIGQFIEDDAVALVKIIENTFCQLAQEYMLTQEELDIVLCDLSRALNGDTLLDMFASPDRQAFSDKLVREQIERLIRGRCRIYLPTETEFVQGIGRLIEDAEHGTGIFARNAVYQTDPVEIGRKLTGEELEPHAARKGLYAAKHMNLAQVQAEGRLRKIAADEQQFQIGIKTLHQERNGMKDELAALLGGTEK